MSTNSRASKRWEERNEDGTNKRSSEEQAQVPRRKPHARQARRNPERQSAAKKVWAKAPTTGSWRSDANSDQHEDVVLPEEEKQYCWSVDNVVEQGEPDDGAKDKRYEAYVAERDRNVFSKYYEGAPTCSREICARNDSSVMQRLKRYSHKDALNFAVDSLEWSANKEKDLPVRRRVSTVEVVTTSYFSGSHAFYRVIAEKDDRYTLLACHANVHGCHRGDLRFVEVNDRTQVQEFEESVVGLLYLGDILAVYELARRTRGPTIGADVASVSMESNLTWMVKRMEVAERRSAVRIGFSFLQNGTAVVMGHDEAMTVLEDERHGAELDKMYVGDAFVPEKYRDTFCSGHHPMFWHHLTRLTAKMCTFSTAFGIIHRYEECPEQNRRFTIGTTAFDPAATLQRLDSPRELNRIVETCTLMGYSAANSLFNGRCDCRPFAARDVKVSGHIVRFAIDNPKKMPTLRLWNPNTRIVFGSPSGNISATIEIVMEDESLLRIVARLVGGKRGNRMIPKGDVAVWQKESLDPIGLENGYFEALPEHSNGRRIIETLYGGPGIALKKPVVRNEYVFPAQPAIKLNDYQCEYVQMVLDKNPLVLGSSPFGCGKSMTIVATAFEVYKRNAEEGELHKQFQQLLVTQSNYASVNLIDIAKKAKTFDIRFVRYVSEKNWAEMSENCRTEYDMPRLMQKVFCDWATGVTPETDRGVKALSTWNMMNIISFLLREDNDGKSLLKPHQLVGKALYHYSGKLERPKNMLDIFFLLYQPDIIMTTADSTGNLLRLNVLKEVSTIQIDEASQVPEYTFITLLSKFPNACFGLIGDIHQLPPYCEETLTGKLKEYGVGNTMERAIKNNMFPKAELRYVYRCHPETTNLLSALFYDVDLIPGVLETHRNAFMLGRADFWPNPSFPIAIINNSASGSRMGTSVANDSEAVIVKQLLRMITKKHNGYELHARDIGVISFYSAQTSVLMEALRGSGVKCGTVDSFQGTEREVVILCCTNEKLSEFMQLANRLNVAMSRARQATIIIGNVYGLRKAKYWSTILEKVEKNGCFIDMKNFMS
ncbi:unnamed protein product [Caenorhabditis sp. 36 PRJEB53466]|nr:unnamed protein product [Caenorhabditis sp. 36 PRJEB53466]